jgi:hypothetical protein
LNVAVHQPVPSDSSQSRKALPWRVVYAVAGLVLAAGGYAALISIPRGADEFIYQPVSFLPALTPLPFSPMTGFTPEQLSSHLARLVFLTPACVLMGMASVGLWPAGAAARAKFSVWTVAIAGAALTLLAALLVIRGVPLQDDDATYLYQARIMSELRALDPPVPENARWIENFIYFSARGTTGKYLFGTGLTLVPGVWLGLPILANLFFVFVTLLCVYRAAEKNAPATVALFGAALLSISPQFIFTSASTLSQAPALAGLAVAVWASERGGFRNGLYAGLAIGFSLVCRPHIAVPGAIALVLAGAWKDRRLLGGAVLGGLPWLVALLAYNYALTGSAFEFHYLGATERYGPAPFAGLGAGDLETYRHTPLRALAQIGVVLTRLNAWSLGFPLSLAAIAFWFALGRPFARAVRPWFFIAVATFVFQAGYYSPGTSETGAVYHHAALPLIALCAAASLHRLRETRFAALATGTFVAALVLGTTSFFVEHALRIRRLGDHIMGPGREAISFEPNTLVFEEPQVLFTTGWLADTPRRERRASAPVVDFPRGSPEMVAFIRSRHPERTCRHLFRMPNEPFQLGDCAQMTQTAEEIQRRFNEAGALKPKAWRDSFAWARWLGVKL